MKPPRWIAIFIVASALLAGQPARAAEDDDRAGIHGRVVDAATGQALEGAVIVAAWWTELLPNPAHIAFGLLVGGHGGSEQRLAQVKQVSSDSEGRFAFPAWTQADQLNRGSITRGSPAVIAFVPGYEPGSRENRSDTVLKLFRYGTGPRPDARSLGLGHAVPETPEEQTIENMRWASERLTSFSSWLEGLVRNADHLDAAADSRPRTAARSTLETSMRMASQETVRLFAQYPELRKPRRFPVMDLLRTSPAYEAERAFRSGDRRPIVLPVCGAAGGEITPGWDAPPTPQARDAVRNGHRPIRCSDVGNDPDSTNSKRVTKYAEEYNRTLLQFQLMR